MARFSVPTPPEFRFRTTLLSHGWAGLAPFETDEARTTLGRVERLEDGTVVRLAVRGGEDEGLEVDAEEPDGPPTAAHRDELARRLHRIFHLDLDLAPFYERLRGEERYAWVERSGAGRLLRCPTVWEDLAKTLMTTNTTWGGTRGMVRRICELGEGGAFPGPERIAALGPEELAGRIRAGYRAPYLHELATALAEGRLDVESWAASDLPSDELYREVRALKGFGPYAAGTVLKLLGRYDQLALDSAARTMYSQRYKKGAQPTDREIEAHYAPYEEWQGLVLWMDLLHHAIGEELSEAKRS